MAERVLLFSGGLDSACLLNKYEFDTVLFIHTDTLDNKKEADRIQFLDFVTEEHMPLVDFELDNKIIPYRNAFFALIAAQHGNEIYLGATKGDTTKDKDYVFASMIESFLNYFAQDKEKVAIDSYPYKVVMPFKEMTKTDIVRDFLTRNSKDDAYQILVQDSRSCYSDYELECGICRSCLRKFVALDTFDIQTNFKYSPITCLQDILEDSIKKGRGEEIADIQYIINKHK